jgi:hypothetical protein
MRTCRSLTTPLVSSQLATSGEESNKLVKKPLVVWE